MTTARLSQVYSQVQAIKYPGIPAHARASKTFSDKTSNGLTTCILYFCEFDKILNKRAVNAQRSGNEGRFRPGEQVVDAVGRTRVMKGQWLPGHNKGMADVTILLNGRTYYVEIKIGRDYQKPDQIKFMERVRSGGAVYEIVKTFRDFYKLYMQWIRKK